MRRPLGVVAVITGAVVTSFVLVLLVAVAADQDAHADDGLSGVLCAPPRPPGTGVVGFAGRQLANAGVVVAVGKELRLPPRAWVAATATAMAESRLQHVLGLVFVCAQYAASIGQPLPTEDTDKDGWRTAWCEMKQARDDLRRRATGAERAEAALTSASTTAAVEVSPSSDIAESSPPNNVDAAEQRSRSEVTLMVLPRPPRRISIASRVNKNPGRAIYLNRLAWS